MVPHLADYSGTLGVGQQEDRQQRVTAKRPEAVETFTELALEFVGAHEDEPSTRPQPGRKRPRNDAK
jgi:hypothetical protein